MFNILFGAIFDYGTDANWERLKVVEKLSAPQCASLCRDSAAQMLVVKTGE